MIEVDYNEYKETIAENMKLIVENHKLKEKYYLMRTNANQLAKRVDKAIDYIENTKFDLSNDEYDLREYDGAKLLKILQGEDKE